MIITITLNPAVDRTLSTAEFQRGRINRVESAIVDVGGKGINVSKALRCLGRESIACGFIAGTNGRFVKDSLASLGIRHDFVEVCGQTRVNIKIVEPDGTHTDINEPGFPVSEQDTSRLLNKIKTFLKPSNLFVISGSTPPGMPLPAYGEICRLITGAGVPLIVDADGPRLHHALSSHPDFVKPNMHELSAFAGFPITDVESAVRGAELLHKAGAKNVVVSMGDIGAVFFGEKHDAIYVKPPAIHVLGPVGAGDAMVGALAAAMMDGQMSFETIARYSVAMGTASAAIEGTRMATRREALAIFEDTAVHHI